MAKKQPKNQLALDFSVRGDRIIFCLGNPSNQEASERIFNNLLDGKWSLEPAGDYAEVTLANDIIRQLGCKLPFPETVKIVRLNIQSSEINGFAAIYKQKGWIFITQEIDAALRNYNIHLLVAVLGLHPIYPNRSSLVTRSETLVADSLLPIKEVSTFFHSEVTKISPSLAADISDYFKVPFSIVIKRAFDFGILSTVQFENFSEVVPESRSHSESVYLSEEHSVDDLESYLFGDEN